jgi:hypothetical protein
MIDLSLIQSLRGMDRAVIRSTNSKISNFFDLPELQRVEEVDAVKGFRESAGMSYQEFERLGDELTQEILGNF